MRLLVATACLILSAAASAVSATALASPHQVEIPSKGGTLRAELYKPDGLGPFPTVIGLHGCGGLSDHSEPVLPRYRAWAARLVKSGTAVLLPDSYGSRGLGPQCHVKKHRLAALRERVADIQAARQWLMQQPWVRHDRISLLGWASGASALLWAVRPQLFWRNTGPDFRTAIAFYPDCRLSAGLGWAARVPTLLLIGAKDNVSSPPACRRMIDGARGRSALARLVVFPGAYHNFDSAKPPPRVVKRGAKVRRPQRRPLGSNARARLDSERLVAQWLSR
ncbi:MAG: dienelactone hydrolase family protein [Bradyrhizobium sp.]